MQGSPREIDSTRLAIATVTALPAAQPSRADAEYAPVTAGLQRIIAKSREVNPPDTLFKCGRIANGTIHAFSRGLTCDLVGVCGLLHIGQEALLERRVHGGQALHRPARLADFGQSRADRRLITQVQ